jgi:acyl dehydratase
MRILRSASDITAAAGSRLGTGRWFLVDQDRIDAFAAATEDRQWIHVDPQAAAAGPFGRTIAHGYLTLALIPHLARDNYRVEGARMAINYGLDRVRFVRPVAVGHRIRAVTDLTAARPVGAEPGGAGIEARFTNVVEIEGETRPACVANGISRFYFAEPLTAGRI